MSVDFRTSYLTDIIRVYRNYKALGERALAQVGHDDDLHVQLDPESNSIAVIVKHLGGNLRSRFREFLTTDGEKPDRHRDLEFEMPERVSRDEMMRWWNDGWTIALASLDSLTRDDLEKTIHVRAEPLLVIEALNRLASHAAYHVGQIVFLAKHFTSAEWQSLSIPRGMSEKVGQGTYKQTFVPPGR
jgi:hypothetical protein